MKDTSAMHWTGDMAVLDEMIQMPEVRALPFLSRALGTMGYNARLSNVLIVLGALESVLGAQGFKVVSGEGVAAALATYRASGAPA